MFYRTIVLWNTFSFQLYCHLFPVSLLTCDMKGHREITSPKQNLEWPLQGQMSNTVVGWVESGWIKLKICQSNAVCLGLVHSSIQFSAWISLPAALADELCPALAPVHAVLPKILFLSALFLFPTKNEKELTTVLLLIMPPLGQHSSFFCVVAHLKKAAWRYVSSTQMLYLDYHLLAAFFLSPSILQTCAHRSSYSLSFNGTKRGLCWYFSKWKTWIYLMARFEAHKIYGK